MCDFELSYESPIVMEVHNIAQEISEDIDNQILATIQEYCQLKINKFELIRALNYDRDQYKKGFEDARKKFERSKGEWTLSSIQVVGENWYKCSECGRKIRTSTHHLKEYPFCHCGADMR